MAINKPADPSTAAKVALGTGVAAAVLGGLLAALGGSKKQPPTKPLGKCGHCGR